MNTTIPKHLLSTLFTISTLLITAPCALAADEPAWHQTLADRVQLYGHRNWIVIADSAYPAQSRDGIETIATGAGQIDVLRQVLSTLESLKHLRPVAYTDAELPHVSEEDAPGITAYRKDLAELLAQQPVRVLPHEEIIAKLDEAGATFKVLILKTDLTLPYTSVFLELDCGYWNAESEKRLRAAMPSDKK
jgi:hypothetical protein